MRPCSSPTHKEKNHELSADQCAGSIDSDPPPELIDEFFPIYKKYMDYPDVMDAALCTNGFQRPCIKFELDSHGRSYGHYRNDWRSRDSFRMYVVEDDVEQIEQRLGVEQLRLNAIEETR